MTGKSYSHEMSSLIFLEMKEKIMSTVSLNGTLMSSWGS